MVSTYFLDSSALVKRYAVETGSAWVGDLIAPARRNSLIIARITWVEVLSALARRQREGSMSPDDMARAVRTFRYDIDMQYWVVELDRPLAEVAGHLVARYPLRAYDAVQLAAALRIRSGVGQMIFLSADDRLLTIAQAEGLLADNPNRHP